MSRSGKIARLSSDVRRQLNFRLRDGEPGVELVAWLNTLPEVREMLAARFGGRPINGQNLSEWKLRGYREWERGQEASAWASDLVKHWEDTCLPEDQGIALSDLVAKHATVALGRLLEETSRPVAGQDPAERLKAVLAIVRALAGLRREDHAAMRVQMEREDWESEQAGREGSGEADALVAPLYGLMINRLFRGMYEHDLKDPGKPVPPELLVYLETMATLGEPKARTTPSAPVAEPEQSQAKSK